MKRIIKFNLWNFLDMNDINNILDDDLLDDKIKGVASDIKYEISNIDKQDNITIKTNFTLDKL